MACAVLRLDHRNDRERLHGTIERIRPRLLVLDPLVRLHGIDENAVADIAPNPHSPDHGLCVREERPTDINQASLDMAEKSNKLIGNRPPRTDA